MMGIRLVVTGGRDFKDVTFIEERLDHLLNEYGICEVIQGEANGVDSICKNWAIKRGVPVRCVPAEWDNLNVKPLRIKRNRYGKEYNVMAGTIRNQKMLDDYPQPDYAVVFPGGRGTNDMRRRIYSKNIIVWDLFEHFYKDFK